MDTNVSEEPDVPFFRVDKYVENSSVTLVGFYKATRPPTTADRNLANYFPVVSLLSYISYLQLRKELLGVHRSNWCIRNDVKQN